MFEVAFLTGNKRHTAQHRSISSALSHMLSGGGIPGIAQAKAKSLHISPPDEASIAGL